MDKALLSRLVRDPEEGALFGLLIDPDNYSIDGIRSASQSATDANVDVILLGGSIVNASMESALRVIRDTTSVPVVLFPGSPTQFVHGADAILFLSLISGRNAEHLIGSHVQVATQVKHSGMEVIPTGYILVDGGVVSSAQYVSNTQPIPHTKTDIAVATALAGELLGLKVIYLEAGSGAKWPVPKEIVAAVCSQVSIPVIVGGGLRSPEQIKAARAAGASMVVVGNALENQLSLLPELAQASKDPL